MDAMRPSTAPQNGGSRRGSEPTLLLQHEKRMSKLLRVGGAFDDMPGNATTGDRFSRFFFPLSDVPDSPTFFGQNTVPAGAHKENVPGMISTIKTRPNLDLEGRAQTRLPFYGHYDVVSGWDIDDPGLDSSAHSPNLGFQRMQMALVPFQHAEPTPCISELYTRPVSARKGAEGSTIRRFPEDPLPSDEYTREALLWKKYATRHTGQSVDVQELAKWVLQLHPRCVQDMKPMVILLQGIIKDLLHEKMTLFAGENNMLRRKLEESQNQSQKDLDDAHAMINELREELAGTEAHSRVKDKFQKALHKLNGVSKQMAEQRHDEDVKKALEHQAKKEVEIFKENQDLNAEVDKLNAKLDNMRKGNMKLNQAHQSSSKSMSDQKMLFDEAKDKIAELEKLIETSDLQAKVRAAATAKWGHSMLKGAESRAGILDVLATKGGTGAKAAWIAESGVQVGSAALAALSSSATGGPEAAADVLLALPPDAMLLCMQAMAPQEIGPIIKEILMKSTLDKSDELTKRVCKSLSSLSSAQAGNILAHTPSPVATRILKHFEDQEGVQSAMTQWRQCQSALSKATESLVKPEIFGMELDENVLNAEQSLKQVAETLDSMESSQLFHLLSTAPGDVGETLMQYMSLSTVQSLRKWESTMTHRHERLEKTVSTLLKNDKTWRLSQKCETAVEALKSVCDFTDLTEKVQELLVSVKQEHGICLTVMNDCGEPVSGGASGEQASDVPDSMLVIGSTETGEALDESKITDAGIDLVAMEIGKRNSKGLKDLVSNASESTLNRGGGHIVKPLFVRGALEGGQLSKNANVKWGAIACSTESATGTDASITAAAQRLEEEEAEFMEIAQCVEDSIEAVKADDSKGTVSFAKMKVLENFSKEKKLKIMRLVSARIIKRLRMARMQQQLRELKSYKNPPYNVLCIVTSLFILIDTEGGLEPYLGKLYRMPGEGSSDLKPLWKYLRSQMQINSVLKAMGALGTPDKDRSRVVTDLLREISHNDAKKASRPLCELRKYCIVKAGSLAVENMAS